MFLNPMPYYSIYEMAKQGDIASLQPLLNNDLVANCQDHTGATLLFYACLNGHEGLVDLLLTKGADPQLRNFAGEYPLHAACEKNSTKIVKKLLAVNVKLDVQSGKGDTPLHYVKIESMIVPLLINLCPTLATMVNREGKNYIEWDKLVNENNRQV